MTPVDRATFELQIVAYLTQHGAAHGRDLARALGISEREMFAFARNQRDAYAADEPTPVRVSDKGVLSIAGAGKE